MHVRDGEVVAGHAGLASAQQVALAPQLEIALGDLEAVVGGLDGLEPRLRGLAQRLFVEQQARRALAAATDAAT